MVLILLGQIVALAVRRGRGTIVAPLPLLRKVKIPKADNLEEASLPKGAIYSVTQQNQGGFTMRWQAISKMTAALAMTAAMIMTPGVMKAQQATDTVLKPVDTQKLLPSAVYYRGQSATTQLRNSGGVKFADGYYLLTTLVDTSGYSTSIAAKYQAYFITEVAIKLGGQNLPAGVYGIGFVADNKLVVTDVGGHDVFIAATGDDADLKRPTPLQVTTDPAGGFRLYAGRRYVILSR